MLVITGLPYCGTSFLAKVLMAMNYKGGVDLNSDCELSSVYDLNRDMYHNQLSANENINLDAECKCSYWKSQSYKYAIQKFNQDKKQGTVSFINDLVFMWSPKIIDAWWQVRKDLRFIILRGETINEEYSKCIEFMQKEKIPFKVDMYPEFLIDAKPLFKHIRILGLQTCHLIGNKLVQEMRGEEDA